MTLISIQCKISKIKIFWLITHTKCGNSTLIINPFVQKPINAVITISHLWVYRKLRLFKLCHDNSPKGTCAMQLSTKIADLALYLLSFSLACFHLALSYTCTSPFCLINSNLLIRLNKEYRIFKKDRISQQIVINQVSRLWFSYGVCTEFP